MMFDTQIDNKQQNFRQNLCTIAAANEISE